MGSPGYEPKRDAANGTRAMPHEEENVQPHERAVHAQDEMEYLVVGEPVNSQDDETDEECRETRPQCDQVIRQTPRAERRGRAEFKDEDRHRDGEDPVDQGLETVLRQSVDVRAHWSVTPGRRFRSTPGPTSADGIPRMGQKAIAETAAHLPNERSSPP